MKKEETTEARNIIALDPDSNRIVNDWLDQTGISKAEFMRRLLEWFSGVDDEVKFLAAGMPRGKMRQGMLAAASKYFARLAEEETAPESIAHVRVQNQGHQNQH